MTPTRPNVVPDGRYPSRIASRLLGVCPDSLRRYANAGLIEYDYDITGHRRYRGSDLVKLWQNRM